MNEDKNMAHCGINDAYVAGLFDGEGNIQFYKIKALEYVRFRLTINQKEVLEQIRDYFGYGYVGINSGRCWIFVVSTYQESIDFISRVIPYLLIKKEKALVALTYLNEHPKRHYRSKHKLVKLR